MQFGPIDIVFFAVLVSQLFIATIASWNLRGLSRKFSQPLGSKVTIVELLQKYSRMYAAVNIKVDADVPGPAGVEADALLLNRKIVYSSGLYHNVFVLFQMLLLLPAYTLLRKTRRVQAGLFLLEILIYVAHVYVYEPLGVVAAFVGFGLLATSFVYQSYLGDILNEVYELSVDLLELDDVESLRAQVLIKEMQAQAFTYAVEPLIWLVKFVFPIRSTP